MNYLTLPSNASMSKFPNNTATKFETELFSEISLEPGRWEVGLAEINFPNNFQRRIVIPSGEHGLRVRGLGGKVDTFLFKAGTYEKCTDVLVQLMRDYPGQVLVAPYKKNGYVRVHISSPRLPGALRPRATHRRFSKPTFLGEASTLFSVERSIVKVTGSIEIILTQRIQSVTIDTIYVYTDLIQPRIYGDRLKPLLRNVAVTVKEGHHQTTVYEKPYFFRLAKNIFRNVRIWLEDRTGQPIQFRSAPVTVTLQFRRVAVETL